MKPPKHWLDYCDHEGEYEAYLELIAAEAAMDWNEGDPKPPWKPDRDKRYIQKMTDFTNWHLDRTPIDFTANPPEVSKIQVEWIFNDGPEIAAAEEGDMEPLRKKYPRLAKFLNPAKRGKGERGPSLRWRENRGAEMAAFNVEEIKAIWQTHYGKKVRRFKPTAVEIAADRHGVAVKDVERWIAHLAATREK